MLAKPGKKIKDPHPLTTKRPMKRIGKATKRWLAYRKQWFTDHPADYKGNYSCGICGQFVHESVATLDHIIPRSRRPDLVYKDDNVQPAHQLCNSEKGSRV